MADEPAERSFGDEGGRDSDSTLGLLARARSGDEDALSNLIERCLPPLRRWAHGRLPGHARGALDTGDLVQEAVLRVLARLDHFESRHVGALQAYLRQAVRNRICDEVRRVQRRGVPEELPDSQPIEGPNPLEQLIASEDVARYEAAMTRLRPAERQVIEARFEWGHSFEDVAIATGKQSADAARMSFNRAFKKLAAELGRPVSE